MVYFNENNFKQQSNYVIKNDINSHVIKGGGVKELKTLEDKEDEKLKNIKLKNVSIIPQIPIKDSKISQEKLNRFVNLKIKF